jgi:hypothetical protein
MRRLIRRHVIVMVPDDMVEFPAHFRELMQKVEDLSGFINSIATGQTELWC